MKKLLTVTAMIVIFASAGAFAADNWSVKLAFSSAAASDVMEVTIGEGDASEMLKPPPLPGSAVTGDSSNAIVNAYAYMRATQKKVAKSILAPDAGSTAQVWEIQVEAEETGSVYVTPDLTSKSADTNVKYFIIDPVTGDTKNLVTDLVDGKVEVYTSDGQPKTLYAMAGTSETFAIVDPTGSVVGRAPSKDVTDLADYSGVDVYINDAKIGTTDADGKFTASGLGAMSGSQTIKLDGKNIIASIGSIDVTDGVGVVAVKDVRRCDFNNDDIECGFDDFLVLRGVYDMENSAAETVYVDPLKNPGNNNNNKGLDADANKDGICDFTDFLVLRKYFDNLPD